MDADVPYHSSAFADIILRSSDDVHFYGIGQLLCLVSPVFMDMLALNRGPAAEENESKCNLPIVPLEEHSETLYLLLDSLLPRTEEPKLTSFSLLWKVGKAVKKYFMDVVEGKLKNRLLTSELISSELFGIYAVATDLEWELVASEAARRTLDIPLESLAFVDQLHGITGLGFYRFLEYRL
ncbi:hypothetical protein M378DRAFT_7902 [Amanita muscaria Koide BX008]|uniref:BTB domain-containing protein n=1 Tax=Amanita muscaria (strain Koide BX008) TaxID=946122 RepID=A0A0C2X4L5_AMAMK|nr:hypothetical protein M378DRAFT_7902 [Amanita muscaria Koide BX008]